jgi:hypothetical protein
MYQRSKFSNGGGSIDGNNPTSLYETNNSMHIYDQQNTTQSRFYNPKPQHSSPISTEMNET